jgi:hypothetical protein
LPSRYRFHGQAIGAGGRIDHPFHEFIDIQAALALPEIGGHGASHSHDFRYRDVLRFKHAYTEVTGAHASGPTGKPVHKSLIRSRVEGLDIGGVVTADRIEARLVSFTEEDREDEPCFKFTGSHFDNLKIAGVPVKVHLACGIFDRLPRHSDIAKSYKEKGEFHGHYQKSTLKDNLKKAPPRVQQWFQQAPEKSGELPHIQGFTSLSLVQRIEPEREEFNYWGHVIYVEGFGTIHLAEVAVSKLKRRLTMIHVDLGSPISGGMQLCEVDGNGTGW